jgi:hypothetical protein
MAEKKKCAHAICDCMVDEGTKYCSEYCEDAVKAGVLEIGCGCEHPACEGS